MLSGIGIAAAMGGAALVPVLSASASPAVDGGTRPAVLAKGLFTLRGYRATPGYDLVTGLGTVNAARLVPELASNYPLRPGFKRSALVGVQSGQGRR
jgi:hypothetical protein